MKMFIYPLVLSLVGLGLSIVSLARREGPKLLALASAAGHLVPSAYWAWWLTIGKPLMTVQ
jgi:hypothetical protein